jgi:hypothetical protein
MKYASMRDIDTTENGLLKGSVTRQVFVYERIDIFLSDEGCSALRMVWIEKL